MISIVEDDVSVRDAIEAFLKSAGVKSKSYGSAEEFLSSHIPEANDILILDLNLPGISGYDLLKKLRRNKMIIHVIVTTGFDEPGSRDFCKKYGVKEYLRKPVDGEALIDLIKYNSHS